jgi:hypothetical protein
MAEDTLAKQIARTFPDTSPRDPCEACRGCKNIGIRWEPELHYNLLEERVEGEYYCVCLDNGQEQALTPRYKIDLRYSFEEYTHDLNTTWFDGTVADSRLTTIARQASISCALVRRRGYKPWIPQELPPPPTRPRDDA